jgi:UDP-N-acetylmuramoyl-L-alanyl-D-glutamate--2,6-diaminopimelate ligase
MLKTKIRKYTPEWVINIYHFTLAHFSALIFGFPSKKMIVIGVTGTSGKSTTCYLLAHMLEKLGFRVGLASTIMFKVAQKEWINDQKMTMVGRFQLQSLLRKMVQAKCKFAIIETTSEGIKQHRHQGIHYDVAMLTNLYPEHIESHGSFENYKAAKMKLFKKLDHDSIKVIESRAIEKTIVINGEDEHAIDFLNHDIQEKFVFGTGALSGFEDHVHRVNAENVEATAKGISFTLKGEKIHVPILGKHNVYNVLAAISVGLSQDISLVEMKKALVDISSIPGRLELIDEGQSFTVIVDFAFEPRAMTKLYETVALIPHERIIHVLGGTGGGRDKDRRPKLGAIASEKADVVIVTNEDPYDEDPMQIIEDVAAGVDKEKAELYKILDRGEAIQKAIELAGPNDMVLITGKGSEQAIVVQNGKMIPWDDREAARKALKP